MNIKKTIAMISAFAMCAAMLTACSSENETEDTTADTTISETAGEETTESAAEETTEAIEEEPVESEGEATEETPAEEGGEVSANPLQPIADAGMAVGEWPEMMEITDTMMLTDFFLLDPANENYRNMLVLQCPMSAVMTEVIIIEANDVEAAKADLTARRDKAIAQDAFYPNDVELAEASIVGSEGDYAYFILAGAAADAEPAIVEAIKAL